MEIVRAETEEQYQQARRLFVEYAEALDFSFCFQKFSEELENLRALYGPPGGCLLLASGREALVGCAAIKRLDDQTCEMKRLYVRPEGRGTGAGRTLAEALIVEARRLGYTRMRLDTLPRMERARALYESLEFAEVAPYCHNPIPGAIFMERSLA